MLVRETFINLTTKELLILLRQGNMLAFDTIYKRYSGKLFYFVVRYVKQETDAEEIIQEVFIKLWENRHKIETDTSFDSFLFTITYNSMISFIRKQLNEKRHLENLNTEQTTNETDDLTDEIHFKELQSQIQSLLNNLTPRQREIFYLSREEGMTHDEIAKKLGVSANTVKNHIVTTLAFLRSHLDNDFLCYWIVFNLFLLN